VDEVRCSINGIDDECRLVSDRDAGFVRLLANEEECWILFCEALTDESLYSMVGLSYNVDG